MSQAPAAAGAARWAGSLAGRIARAWRVLPPERRLAAGAAAGLFVTLFLPWYQETAVVNGAKLQTESVSLTGWGAFSFVEAAVLLVAVSVLVLLLQRAEGHAFHVPGGDGFVVTAAGFWTCVLIVWRIFDKQGTTAKGQVATSSGIEWGIFVALAVAAVLAYAGSRIRAAHVPEPPLPGEDGPPEPAVVRAPVVRRSSRRARPVAADRAAGGSGGQSAGGSGRAAGGSAGRAGGGSGRAAGGSGRAAGGSGRAAGGSADPSAGENPSGAQTPPTLRYDEYPTRRRAPAAPDDQLTIPLERDE
jgi:hypothetical protein